MKKLLSTAMAAWLFSFAHLFAQSSTMGMCDYQESDCNCCPNNTISLCCPSHTFCVEGTLLYLQPYASNLHYVAEAEPLPVPSPNWRISDIRPDYHFGFDIGVGAVSHCRNAEIKLCYTHFYSKDSASKIVPTSDMVGPFFEIGPDASPYSQARGHVAFHFDALKLDYGVCVKLGDHLTSNFFGGLAGVHLKQDLSSFYSNVGGTIARSIKTPSSFWGVGPQLGANFSYGICDGLQLTGGSSAALLVGDLKNHTTYNSVSPLLPGLGITPPNHQTTHVQNRTQVVPAFEGKVGLAYEFSFCDCPANLDAGYEVRLYMNAIQSVDMGSEVVTPPVTPDVIGVYARTFQRTISNFALAGPYLRINIGF